MKFIQHQPQRVLEKALTLAVAALLAAQVATAQPSESNTAPAPTPEATPIATANPAETPTAAQTPTPAPTPEGAQVTIIDPLAATPAPVATPSAKFVTGATGTSPKVAEPITLTVGTVNNAAVAGLSDQRQAQSTTADAIDLEDAIAIALQNNPQRQAALAAVRAAEARIGTARSAGGVQVGLSGNVDASRSFGGSGNSGGTGGTGGTGGGTGGTGSGSSSSSGDRILGFNVSESVGVNAQLPIYNGGRVSASTRAAQANAEVLAAQERQTEQDLVLNTTTSYLNVLRNEELLRVAESNVGVSQERLRVANVRFTAGAAARLEVLTAQTTLAEAQQRREAASATTAQSRSTLNTLLGRAPETPLRVEPIQTLQLQLPLINGAISSPALRATAESTRPTIDASRAQIESSTANVDLARAQRRPNLGLDLGALIRNPVSFAGRFVLSLGLGLTQNLFDSGRTRSQITEAQALLEQSRQGLTGQRLTVANQIEQSLLSLDSAQARTDSADAAVTQAQEALRAAQLGFEAGVRTSLEVSDAQTALLTAQTNAVNARYDVATAQAQLAAAVGVLTVEQAAAAQQTAAADQARLQEVAAQQAAAQPKKKRKKFLGIF